VAEKRVQDLSEIEQNQAALRHSIEAAKELAEDADSLLRKARAGAARPAPEPKPTPQS
jgi:hypothetical protein